MNHNMPNNKQKTSITVLNSLNKYEYYQYELSCQKLPLANQNGELLSPYNIIEKRPLVKI